MELTRMVIYTKDIQRITGRTNRYARKVMFNIKMSYGKQKHQLVSVTELCEYMGLKTEEVVRYLED
jgi:hypothetical protein